MLKAIGIMTKGQYWKSEWLCILSNERMLSSALHYSHNGIRLFKATGIMTKRQYWKSEWLYALSTEYKMNLMARE